MPRVAKTRATASPILLLGVLAPAVRPTRTGPAAGSQPSRSVTSACVDVGVATTRETETVTLRIKLVVLVTPPPVDVTVIGKLPAGVDPLVFTVNTVEQVGLQEAVENDPVAAEGSPETEKATD